MYRTSADPNATETLETFAVVTSKGKHLFGILLGLALVAGVMLGVTLFAGGPREAEAAMPLMGVAAVVLGGGAIAVQQRRARTLTLSRHGEVVSLGADETTRLVLPLTARGAQITSYVNGVPLYEAYLQLADSARRGLVVGETRGAIHGQIQGFYKDGVDPEVRALASFEVRSVGELVRLRDAVATWSARVSAARE